MLIGYSRCSARGQNHESQIDALERAGCERIFIETASGTRSDRPQLTELLDFARPGDTVVVLRLDRLARDVRQILDLVDQFMVPDTTKMNIESARAFSRSLAALLQAAAASRARPVERQLGPPSPAEIDLYVTALSETDITANEAALIDDPGLIAQADPVTSCRVRRILMDGVVNLPPATASRFVAGMLSQNVSERARLAAQ